MKRFIFHQRLFSFQFKKCFWDANLLTDAKNQSPTCLALFSPAKSNISQITSHHNLIGSGLKDQKLKDRTLKDQTLKDRTLKDRTSKDQALKDRTSKDQK